MSSSTKSRGAARYSSSSKQRTKGPARIQNHPIQAPAAINPALKLNPRWYDGAALALYIAVAAATLLHHEPWADEAQAWLLARDLGWLRLIFSELRFEGHPGLWHTILWIAIHWFHASYPALGWIGLASGTAGAAALIFLAPFPRSLRYLVAFSFYFLYQYTVVARSYNLIPLLAFLAAWCYRRGESAILPFTLSLILLANVSVQGVVIALAMAFSYGWRAFRDGAFKEESRRRKHLFALSAFCAALLILAFVLWPPNDTIALADAGTISFSEHLAKVFRGIGYAFSDSLPFSLLIAGVLLIWSITRKLGLMFAIAVLGNAVVYGFLRGVTHHLGIMVAASVAVLWCGWPTSHEVSSYSSSRQQWHRAAVAGLCLLFAYQSWWSWSAVRFDWVSPYSGAREAASYLKSAGAVPQDIDGFYYLSVAVQPYFERNIFKNWKFGGAFFHNSVEFRRDTIQDLFNPTSTWAVLGTLTPDRIPLIVSLFQRTGYTLVHVAEGTVISHSAELSMPGRETYLIFRRNRAIASSAR